MLTQNELDSLGVWDWDADGFPPYWEQLRRYVFKRDGYRCKYCHKVFRNIRHLDAHHITFRQAGGSDNPRNLATVCEPCHNQIHLYVDDKRGRSKASVAHSIISSSTKFVMLALARKKKPSPKVNQELFSPMHGIIVGHSVNVMTDSGIKKGFVLEKDTENNRVNVKVRNGKGRWIVISKTIFEIVKP